MADPVVNVELEKREANPDPPETKKSKKWLILILALILLAGSGIGAVIFFAPQIIPDSLDYWRIKDSTKGEKEAAKKTQGHIYNMDPFTVNLADSAPPRFLKIKISIESREMKMNEEYEKRLPQLRDTMLTILSSKSYREIFDSEGKKKLREEITSRLNQLLSSFQVKTIYFTEFLIQ